MEDATEFLALERAIAPFAEGFSVRRGAKPGDWMYPKHPSTHWTETQWRQYMWGYDRLLEMVDDHIRQMMDALDEQGLLEDTVHGEPLPRRCAGRTEICG